MKHKKIAVLLPAFLFSINILIAISFKKYDDFSYIFGNVWNIAKSIVLTAGYTLLFGILLHKLYTYVENTRCNLEKTPSYWLVTIVSFFILLLCYIPYLYVFYPCSINSDSTDQLAQFFGVVEISNHHPYFSTLLMGWLAKIGIQMGNPPFGIFLYVILQTLVLAFAFAYTLGIMVKWKLPWKFTIAFAVFYGVMPFWGGYAQLVIKDTLYTAVMVLFVTLFLDLLLECKTGAVALYKMLILVIIGLLTSLLRNNGIYAVAPALLGGVIFAWKKRNRYVWLAGFLVCMGLYFVWGSVILPANNVKEGSIREALSIPFQQTARYIREYPDEVTPEEHAAISAVLDYERIGNEYLSTVADPVKNTYKEPEDETGALARYFKHWFLMFFKHPSVYFEATVANSYYYFCANVVECMGPIYVNFIHPDDRTAFLELTAPEENAELRTALTKYTEGFRDLPLLRFLYSEGLYTYMLIGMIGFLFFVRKKRYIVGLIPNMMGVLVCIASPVQGNVRYFLPVMACTCICMAFCMKCKDA